MLEYAHELGLKGAAITDHEALSSFVKAELFLNQKKKEDESWKDFKLILGNEIYLCRNGLNKDNFVKGTDKFFHFILLSKDYDGYKQLCELSSRAWKRAYKQFQVRVPTYYEDLIEVVGANPGHLIGSTACIGGQIGTKLLQIKDGKISESEGIDFCIAWINRMKEIFAEGDFYLELQPGINKEQIFCNNRLIALSQLTNTPFIITTDHHYTKKEDRKIHKAFLKSKNGEREVDDFYEATYMMSAEEIHERMDDQIGAGFVQRGLDETNKINEKIENYSLLKPLNIPYLPKEKFDVPLITDVTVIDQICEKIPNFRNYFESEDIADRQFAARIIKFLNGKDSEDKPKRIDIKEKIDRIDLELGITWDAGRKINVSWSRYLLQVADYINIYWTDGDSIICPSRGSAGASYLCYALGIIQIDPTRESAPLIFQRFINPDRASVLDIDIDVCSNRRDRCIKALENTYGKDQVTRVATFKTEKSRSAILTAARAIGIDVDIARYISSLIGAERGIQYTLAQTYYGDEENGIAPSKAFQAEMANYPELWEIAQGIEGLISGVG